jgi:basic amino acid/polyamine antiporter, APA family
MSEITSPEFKRSISLFDATMMVAGSMIGSGIFIVSADIARQVGSPYLLLGVWLITGVLTLVAALSYGELAGMMPKAGGQYIYLREAYNPLAGFLYGWTFFTVIQTGTIAAVVVAFAKYTAVFIPFFSEKHILLNLAGLPISGAQLLAIGCIVLLTFINSRGIEGGKTVQSVFTSTKLLALIGLIIAGFIAAISYNVIPQNFGVSWPAVKSQIINGSLVRENLSTVGIIVALGVSQVGSLFSSDAWNNITFIAGEVKKPERNIPLSLFFGTLIVTVLYLAANVVFLLLVPLQGVPDGADVASRGIQFCTSDRVGEAAASVIFGGWGSRIMAILVMISTFGCANGLILAGARVYYAMAKDNLFFKQAASLNSRQVPANALIMQSIWASLLCLSGTYGNLLDYVIFAVLIFYVLTIIGIFVLRRKQPNTERPYRAIGYPVIPALYVFLALGICIILLIYKPAYTWPGMIIVSLGIPVYFLTKRMIHE